MEELSWNILLVDDDPDDHALTRAWLAEARGDRFTLHWADSYEAALQTIETDTFDVILVDYDLGQRSGLDLLREAIARGVDAPFIMLTGRGGFELDLKAMRAGAVDYLSKNDTHPLLLERSIRYAIERKRVEDALRKARDELELRVRERTQDLRYANQELHEANERLQEANRELQSEIAERQRAEAALREREARLNLVMEGIPAILWTTDEQLRFNSLAGRGLSDIGLVADQLVGMDAREYTRQALSPGEVAIAAHQKALKGEAAIYATTIQGRHYQCHLEPLRDDQDRIIGVIGIALDITERVEAQELLAYHARLLDNVNDAVIATDETYRINAWNKAAEAIYGWKAAEVLGRDATDVLGTRYVGIDREEGLRRLRETGSLSGEFVQNRKNGEEIWVDAKIIALMDEARRITGYVAVNRDITERKLALVRQAEAEQAIRASEARFRAIFEASAIGIELRDLQGRILAANPALQEMLGYAEDELRQLNDAEITHPADAPANAAMFQALVRGEVYGYRSEKRYLHKNGGIVWARLAASLMRDQYHNPQFAIVMIENISERKQMEARLEEVRRRLVYSRESERLTLAQELHDGPVQDLYAIAYSIAGTLMDNAPNGLTQELENIKNKVEGVVHVLRMICGELRPPTLAPFGLEKTIRSHAENFQQEHPEIWVELDLRPDGQTLPEPVRLALFRIYQQALINVVRHSQADHVQVRFHYDQNAARLEVIDNGCGFHVPEGWIDFVRSGHFGLAGSAERAEAAGGVLKVESQPGQGTRLRVEIPLESTSNPQDAGRDKVIGG